MITTSDDLLQRLETLYQEVSKHRELLHKYYGEVPIPIGGVLGSSVDEHPPAASSSELDVADMAIGMEDVEASTDALSCDDSRPTYPATADPGALCGPQSQGSSPGLMGHTIECNFAGEGKAFRIEALFYSKKDKRREHRQDILVARCRYRAALVVHPIGQSKANPEPWSTREIDVTVDEVAQNQQGEEYAVHLTQLKSKFQDLERFDYVHEAVKKDRLSRPTMWYWKISVKSRHFSEVITIELQRTSA